MAEETVDVQNLRLLLMVMASKTEFGVLEVPEWPFGLIYEELDEQAGFLLKKHQARLQAASTFEESLNIVRLRPVCSLVDFVEAVFKGFLFDSFLNRLH